MPVRALNSSVFKWPDAATVDSAVREWAGEAAANRPEVQRIGYFGSYARGDWGVGSDVDLFVIVESAADPFERRAIRWDTAGLPVPADVLVYTQDEWHGMADTRFHQMIDREAVWVYGRGGPEK